MRGSRHLARLPRNRGLALVLVVLLLAFIMLLLVGLGTLVRVESRVAANQLLQLQARRHALIGLAKALGQLQETAGPDRRATSRASFVSGTQGNRHQWTGVWAPGEEPVWLVSSPEGTSPNPSANSFGDPVILVGSATAEITAPAEDDPDQVRVEAVNLTVPAADFPGWSGSDDPVVGKFAYWVGDEAVKPSLVTRDERSAVTGQPAPDPFPQPAVGAFWNDFDLHQPGIEAELTRVLSYWQLGYVDGTAFSAARLRRNYHRVTLGAFGVLSNGQTGGLRREADTGSGTPYLADGAGLYDEVYLAANPAPFATIPGRLPVARQVLRNRNGQLPSVGDLSGVDAAAHVLVAGAFNLNSIAADAGLQRERWRAVLGAAAMIHFDEAVSRELTEAELDALAAQLTASRLRTAFPDLGKDPDMPFASVGDFAQSGLLQDAIDSSPINAGRTEDSPDWVSQDHLLSLLAPILFARSDTFVIRAYGQVRNPVLDIVEGEAWCEAVVQRLPDWMDPAEAPSQSPILPLNLQLGRRFAVVSFRWLGINDL